MNLLTNRGTQTVASALTVVAQRLPFIKDIGVLLQSTSGLLRWAAPLSIEMIGTHSVSGASTTIKPAAGSTNPTSATQNQAIASWIFRASPETAADYTVTGLPPGITFTFNKNASGGYQFLAGTPTSSGTYQIAITGWRYANHTGGTSAKTTYNLTMNIAPAATPVTISGHPLGGTYAAGSSITLNVAATGGSLSYQWKKGTQNVGTNSASYTINGFSAASAGSYTVTVSNGSSSLTSNAALLVLQAPIDTWKGQQGWNQSQLNDPAISGPNADPDLDGLENVLEYALNLNPRHADMLPGMMEDDPTSPSTHFRYTIPLNPASTDLIIGFQKSSGVGAPQWSDIGESDPIFPITRTPNSISVRIPKNETRAFVRLSAKL